MSLWIIDSKKNIVDVAKAHIIEIFEEYHKTQLIAKFFDKSESVVAEAIGGSFEDRLKIIMEAHEILKKKLDAMHIPQYKEREVPAFYHG